MAFQHLSSDKRRVLHNAMSMYVGYVHGQERQIAGNLLTDLQLALDFAYTVEVYDVEQHSQSTVIQPTR